MLKGKTVLITGSTSGIGLDMAKRFAEQGANLVINGLGNPDDIEKERSGLEKDYNVKVIYGAADMSKSAEIDKMFVEISKVFDGVDVLINNAGIQFVSPIVDFPAEKWEAIIAIDLSASFYTIKNALPSMKKKNWGRIINIASVHGIVASENKSAYVAAKHGLVGLTKVTALEVATQMITCNAICPGWVKTPLLIKQINDKAKAAGVTVEQMENEFLAEKHPSMRFISEDHIADTAIFLCSDAGSSITGTNIALDGGWTVR